MIIGIGTPTSQSNIPLPMIASICCLWSDNHSGYSQFLTSGGVTLNCFVNSVRLECRSPSQSPAVSANPLFINAYDFLRDVTPIAACRRPNRRNRLSFPKGLHLFRHHASRFGSGQSTAAGYTHQTKCYDALRLQRQHGGTRCSLCLFQLVPQGILAKKDRPLRAAFFWCVVTYYTTNVLSSLGQPYKA